MIFSAIHWAMASAAVAVIVWDVVEISGVRERACSGFESVHPTVVARRADNPDFLCPCVTGLRSGFWRFLEPGHLGKSEKPFDMHFRPEWASALLPKYPINQALC
jgi:hypothetical protein